MKRVTALMLPLTFGGCIIASQKPDFDTRLIASPAPIPKMKGPDQGATPLPAPAPLIAPVPCDKVDVTDTAQRNDCIQRVKGAIENAYQDYRRNIAKQVGLIDEVTDIGSTSSSTIATAAGGIPGKVFSGIAGAFSGARTAFGNDALYQQSLNAIFKQMDADRTAKWAGIQISMQSDTKTYPMSEADNDLLAYYRAGTIENAISSLDANAGTAKQACQAASDAVDQATKTSAPNGGGAAKVQPPAATPSAQQNAAPTTAQQCSQIAQAAQYALGVLPAKPEDVITEAKTISRNVFNIPTNKKSELDDVAKAVGVPVSADFTTESLAIRLKLTGITDMNTLNSDADRIKTATGQDFTK